MKKKLLSLLLSFSMLSSFTSSYAMPGRSISAFTACKYTGRDNNDMKVLTVDDELEEPVKCTEENLKYRKNKNLFVNFHSTFYNTKELSWFFKPNNRGLTPEEPPEVLKLLKENSGYYVGNTDEKELYLTFDEGYENGFTGKILDVLKKHNVKAAFFVVEPYLERNRLLIKRMVDEGHLVCNHSAHHPSMAKVTDFEKFKKELAEVEEDYKEITNKDMPKFFRPPMGRFSELSLHYTKELGYKTVFWSLAHYDWDVKKQPNPEEAKKLLLKRTHNGSIILLHAVSKTNTEILDDLITSWKTGGYTLKSLDQLPQ
ncbi:MAG: delta-lactam-biosynthetic de-N-acetylase [Bacillota bacterium]|nr:delta-lactam-biosynthetic de-N-acetylase [Bacillota bacterium]